MGRTAVLATFLLGASALPAHAQSAVRSDEQLVRDLRGDRQDAKSSALGYIREHMPASRRSPEVERALISELIRLNAVREARWEADRIGKLEGDFPADYHGDLIHLVAQSADARTIPALVGALGTGVMVEEGLVKFGEQALPDVLRTSRRRVASITGGQAGDTPAFVVQGALMTLTRLIRTGPVSASARQRITAVARERLYGQQDSSVVIGACQLAVATGDEELRARVRKLVDDPAELQSLGLGIQDAQMVSRYAREALAKK